MKAGECVVLPRGFYKGAKVKIIRINKETVGVEFLQDFYAEMDDYDGDEICQGDRKTLSKNDLPSTEADLRELKEQILEKALSLRGLLLKKQLIEDPKTAEAAMAKLLECVSND